ncbi:MAG: peptidoglycan-binding domain-containing protein [Albidovulum sp.]|nr:peptidoglycan-binding domain-containing protein [Albidovulum sp.]
MSEVQRALGQIGYYPGENDGVWGQRSSSAMEGFQNDNGLTPTGTLNRKSLIKMLELYGR